MCRESARSDIESGCSVPKAFDGASQSRTANRYSLHRLTPVRIGHPNAHTSPPQGDSIYTKQDFRLWKDRVQSCFYFILEFHSTFSSRVLFYLLYNVLFDLSNKRRLLAFLLQYLLLPASIYFIRACF